MSSRRLFALPLAAVLCLLATPVFAEAYPQEVQDAFMESCTSNGGPEPICQCTLEQMEAVFPLARLEANDLPEDQIVALTEKCIAKHLGDVAPPAAGSVTDRICAHLAKHAVDYSEEDAAGCLDELQGVLDGVAADQHEPLAACVLAQQPVTTDVFAECLTTAMEAP